MGTFDNTFDETFQEQLTIKPNKMECEVKKKNLGLSKCNKLPAMIRGMITTAENFKFTPSDLVDANTFKAALEAAMVAGLASRIYLWPFFDGFEDASEEAVYEDTPLGVRRVRDGKYAHRYHITQNICLHKNMFSHRANNGRVFWYDLENQLIGTEDEDNNFMGFSINLLNTEKMRISDGTVSTTSPIYLVLKNNKELDQKGVILGQEIAFVVNNVSRLTDISLEVEGNILAASFKVKVYQTCDGTPINGLQLADFVLTDANGAAQPIESIAEVDGTYTLTAPLANPFEDGSLTLRAPSLLTVKAYEVVAPIAINIP